MGSTGCVIRHGHLGIAHSLRLAYVLVSPICRGIKHKHEGAEVLQVHLVV